MKKLFMLALCALMAVCLCACGGEEKEQPVVTAEPTAEATQEPTPEPTYVGMTQIAGVWMPELPFSGWEGMNQDNINAYELTTFEAYYDPNSDGLYESAGEMFKAYAMSLADYDFEVKEIDTDQYEANNADGASIYLTYYGDGYAQITIYR